MTDVDQALEAVLRNSSPRRGRNTSGSAFAPLKPSRPWSSSLAPIEITLA
jgi:hypothetical protein